MDIINKYLYLSIFAFVIFSCDPQNQELQEAQLELEQEIESIESLLNFVNGDFVLAPVDNKIKDSLTSFDFREPFKLKDSLIIEKEIESYLDSLHFYETINYPSNYIELDYDNNNIGSIIGYFGYFTDRKKEEPVFLLKEVFFKDNSKLSKIDTIDNKINVFKKGAQLKSSKPIDRLLIEVSYQYPIIEKISLTKSNTRVSFTEGDIFLKKIDKNEVTLIMPKSIEDKIVDMNAIYEDGRVLDRKGMSGNTLPARENLLFFEKVLSVKKIALKKLKDNEFKDENELKAFIKKRTPKEQEPTGGEQLFTGTYYFKGNVSSIELFIKKNNNIFNKKNILIETGEYKKSLENKNGYYIATDSTTGKDGLVGVDGKWKIMPSFKDLRISNDFYYKGTYGDDLNQLYHLIIANNQLHRISSYELEDIKLHHNNLIIFKKDSSYLKVSGVLNAKTNETVISPKYLHIREQNNFFIVENLDKKEGVYDKNGKQILTEKYDNIDVSNSQISTYIDVPDAPDIRETFSLKGIKLNN